MANYLIVLNKDEHTVSFIDPYNGDTVKKINVDTNPHEVDLNSSGSIAYVTNSGGNTVSVIDTNQIEEVKRIQHEGFKFPHGVGVTKDDKSLFIASTYANKVYVIDTTTNQVRHEITTNQQKTHMIYFSPNKDLIYVPNIGSNNITIIDVEDESVITHIPVGVGPEGAAVCPNNNKLYVANQHDNNIYIINQDTYEVEKTIRVGTLPIRLVFSPDGKYAFVPNRESGDLSIIDTELEREIKRIRVGVWPGGTVFNTDGSYAYVANNKTNDISVIDVKTLKEVKRIDAGIHPDGMIYLDQEARQ